MAETRKCELCNEWVHVLSGEAECPACGSVFKGRRRDRCSCHNGKVCSKCLTEEEEYYEEEY